MIFKRPKSIPRIACPLCEKEIAVRDIAVIGFVKHLRRCERYKALTAMAALFQGLRLPRYGGALLREGGQWVEIERAVYDSAVDRFTEFMMQKGQVQGQDQTAVVYDDIPIIRCARLADLLALLRVRIKPDVP